MTEFDLVAWADSASEGERFVARCHCRRPSLPLHVPSYKGCANCGGTGSVARDLLYSEGGRAYPFFLHYAEIVDGVARCFGGVSLTLDVADAHRTRGNIELMATPRNGGVSPGAWNLRAPPEGWCLTSPTKALGAPSELRAPKRRVQERSPDNRNPPPAVREQLRKEVGFGCPVCGSPYLTFDHFDPPWEVEHHHDPARMIALCWSCHAEARSYTTEQLRALKKPKDGVSVGERFKWRRDKLVVVCGALAVHEASIAVLWRDAPIVWFERDDDHCLLLSVQFPSLSDEPRFSMTRNAWSVPAAAEDIECPPTGDVLRVRFRNGDAINIRFRPIADSAAAAKAFPNIETSQWTTPVVAVEFGLHIEGTDVQLSSDEFRVGGLSMSGNIFGHPVAIRIDTVGFHGDPPINIAGDVRVQNWRTMPAAVMVGG